MCVCVSVYRRWFLFLATVSTQLEKPVSALCSTSGASHVDTWMLF
jgi:hypothetical protein